MKNDCGITLLELVVASSISLVVILAVGQLDVTRVLLSEQVRQTSNTGGEAQLAMAQFVRDAQRADRINVLGPANVQLRIPQANCDSPGCTCLNNVPEPACFDQAAGYRWVQYKLAAPSILFYHDTVNGCGPDRTFHDISGFTVGYSDAVQRPPPGGEPPVQDNNVLLVQVTTANGQAQAMAYQNTATMRAGAYTNVHATSGGDSGTGLDVAGVSAPPAPC